MELTDVDFVLKAKAQLRRTRQITIVAVALGLALLAGSIVLKGLYHDLAISMSYGSIIGALLANSDFSLYSFGLITRARLIEVVEAQVNRDPKALQYLSDSQT
jgi:hypothetical protein